VDNNKTNTTRVVKVFSQQMPRLTYWWYYRTYPFTPCCRHKTVLLSESYIYHAISIDNMLHVQYKCNALAVVLKYYAQHVILRSTSQL